MAGSGKNIDLTCASRFLHSWKAYLEDGLVGNDYTVGDDWFLRLAYIDLLIHIHVILCKFNSAFRHSRDRGDEC